MGIIFSNTADLITRALKDIGVVGFGRSATAMEIEDGLQVFNLMLDHFGVLRENISIRTTENFPFIIDQSIYTIGVGGNFNTTKPIKIEIAYYRDSNNIDYPIDCSMTEKEYSSIPIKNLLGTPKRLWYQPSVPLGNIKFDFAPTTAWQLYISSWKPFTKIVDSSSPTELVVPDGVEAALAANLSLMLCPANRKQAHEVVIQTAYKTLEAVQAAYGEGFSVENWGVPGTDRGKSNFFSMNEGS